MILRFFDNEATGDLALTDYWSWEIVGGRLVCEDCLHAEAGGQS